MDSLDYAYRRLVNILGPERVARSLQERMAYSHDFASLPKFVHVQWKVTPDFVVIPKRTEEIVRLARFAEESGLPLVPRGGGTGLYGGSVPNRGGVLVDLRAMDRIERIDREARLMTVQAGATWKSAYDRAWKEGLFLPVYPLGAPATTIGGWISSNGVGYGSYKYGTARDIVVDLEVVLPSGAIVHSGDDHLETGHGMANSSGVFVGGEGTTGIVAAATLRLFPRPEEIRPLTYVVESIRAAQAAVPGITELAATPYHVGVVDENHISFLKAVRGEELPAKGLLNIVLEGPRDEIAEDQKEIDGFLTGEGATKAPEATARRLWDGRFDLFPARRLSGGLVIAETIVPAKQYPRMLTRTDVLIRKLKLQVAVNSLLVDRNTVAVTPYFLMDDLSPLGPTALGFVKKLGDLAFELGGHPMGLGLFMVFNLERMHRGAKGILTTVKDTLDPRRKMNPGKTVEVWTKFNLPFVDTIPPSLMARGLDLAAFVRSLKPGRDRFAQPAGGAGGYR